MQSLQVQVTRSIVAGLLFVLIASSSASGQANPVVDSFTATPASAVPGQALTLAVTAHDPDCTAPPCTTVCGSFIASELTQWIDDSRRASGAFTNNRPDPSSSPWSGTVTWNAPAIEGFYNVYLYLFDSGDSTCGGRKNTIATLPITVSSTPIPIVDSMTIVPATVPVGATATVRVVAHDPLGRPLTYAFSASSGTIAHTSSSDSSATWTAPLQAGAHTIRCKVSPPAGLAPTSQVIATTQIGTFLRSIEVPESRPTRVANMGDGRFAAADGASGLLLAADAASGRMSWRRTGLEGPVSVISHEGELLVLERDAHRISVWDKAGTRLREIPLEAVQPNQMAAGPGVGELSVVDTASARVLIISSATGDLLRSVGVGVLKVPTGVSVANGRIAVADSGLGRVVIFEPSGTTRVFGSSSMFVRPQGVMWDSIVEDRLIVSDTYSGEVVVISASGALRGTLGGFGETDGATVNPIDTVLLPGNVLAVTTGGGGISMFRLLATLPSLAPPTAVIAGDRIGDDGGAVTVSWTSAADSERVTGYHIERATGESGIFEPLGSLGAGATTFVDASTIDGTCYHYRVRASDGTLDATSDATPCVESRNDLPPPSPASAVAEADSPFEATVSWPAVTAADLAGYVVAFSTGGGGELTVRTRDVQRATLGSLQPETTYALTVRAIDAAGNLSTPTATVVTTYPDIAPPTPVVTVESAAGGGAAIVTWTVESSRVPITRYRVTCEPKVAGWPVVTGEATGSPLRVGPLVNQLAYDITVIAETPWGRAGDASTPAAATPTSPVRALPLVNRVGWDGNDGIEDAAGFRATFALEAEKRELRFEYRASGGARLQFFVDGTAAGLPFDSTDGQWKEARFELAKYQLKFAEASIIEVRNAAFPTPGTQLAVRRFDFVPLAQKDLKTEAYNTVVDLVWTWQESRRDLTARLVRMPDLTAKSESVPCAVPRSGRCRDTGRVNEQKFIYRLNIISPAGWGSIADEVKGEAKNDSLPPPITDLAVEADFFPDGSPALKLSWTPVTTSTTRNGAPEAVARYRIYRSEKGSLLPLGEVDAPPALVATNGFDRARHVVVVRSVDALGKESP